MSQSKRVSAVFRSVREELRLVLALDEPFLFHLALWSFAAASVLVSGYRIFSGTDNHSLQIPLVLSLNDPSLFAGDRFVESLTNYTTVVWLVVAKLARLVPLEPLLFVLFLLRRLALFYAVSYLASCIVPGSRFGRLAAVAFLAVAPVPMMGGGLLLRRYFEHTGVSFVPFLLVMASLIAGRPWAVAVWYSIGFMANPMYGVYIGTFAAAAWLVDGRLRKGPTVGPLLLTGVLCLPVVLWILQATSVESSFERWWQAARMRFPHHLLEHIHDPAPVAVLAVLALLALALAGSHVGRDIQLGRPVQLAWALVASVWVVLSFQPSLRIPPQLLMVLQPARALDLWELVIALAVLVPVAAFLGSNPSNQSFLAFGAAFAALVYLLVTPFAVLPLALFALGVVVIVALREIGLAGGNEALPWIAGAMITVVLATHAYVRTVDRGWIYEGPDAEVVEVAQWAREETVKDARFVVSPHAWSWSHFRSLSKRPVLGTWKDGAALLWDRSYVDYWLDLLAEFGIEDRFDTDDYLVRRELGNRFLRMSDEEKRRLASKHGVDYWVTRRDRRSELPVLFKTKQFKVLSLIGADDRHSQDLEEVARPDS